MDNSKASRKFDVRLITRRCETARLHVAYYAINIRLWEVIFLRDYIGSETVGTVLMKINQILTKLTLTDNIDFLQKQAVA